jgi:hypothetical protein
LFIGVRLRNLIRGGLGPIWAVSAIGWMEMVNINEDIAYDKITNSTHVI